jgi:hypothetical protein
MEEMSKDAKPMYGTYDTSKVDKMIAMVFPSVLAGVCLPLILMRASMMELELLVVRKKQVNQEIQEIQDENSIFAKNIKSKELKSRIYFALFWSIIGAVVIVVFVILLITFVCITMGA